MRSTLRIAGLLLLLSALLLPLVGYASDVPCPDDPNNPVSLKRRRSTS